jgi:hypothetical protein
MKKLLEYCFLNNCVLSVSFEIPMQITLSVRNWELGQIKTQMLPNTTQTSDDDIERCVRWMIDELNKGKSLPEGKTLVLSEYEQNLLLGWYGVAEHESQTNDDDDNLYQKIKELL